MAVAHQLAIAADYTHDPGSDCPGERKAFDHLIEGLWVSTAFQSHRMAPGVDPFQLVFVQESFYLGQVVRIETRYEARLQRYTVDLKLHGSPQEVFEGQLGLGLCLGGIHLTEVPVKTVAVDTYLHDLPPYETVDLGHRNTISSALSRLRKRICCASASVAQAHRESSSTRRADGKACSAASVGGAPEDVLPSFSVEGV